MMDLDFAKFVEWAFMAVVGGGIAWSAKILTSISRSINLLNQQVSMILEKTAWHEKEIERHNDRLTKLERHD